MRRIPLLVVLPVAFAGCGGDGTSASRAQKAADCLNAKGYLVTPAANAVAGNTRDGVTFILGVAYGRTEIDDSGNPPATSGGKPRRLTAGQRDEIRDCAD